MDLPANASELSSDMGPGSVRSWITVWSSEGLRLFKFKLDPPPDTPYRYPYLTQKEKSRAKTQRRQEIFKDLPKRQVTGYRVWTAQPPQQRTEATEISWGGNHYLLKYCFYYYLCDLASWRELS
jgi:hypothetical protein